VLNINLSTPTDLPTLQNNNSPQGLKLRFSLSQTKEEFLRLAKAKLQEHKNPWIKDTLQSILNLAI